ncbi:MAG: phosphoglucosamine mutase [Rhodospirillaceae bacterium]|nr:phosphoglucosamine mutase [Alphaproteobacteria bacterium]MBR73282.1 phosphoglucosamine mutase [Rhodospirillaceae bacterium]|tara:strand:- start:8710 stop:10056 length:1347 start_codon:yes stop_codon:yes gene_type:complete
MTRKYFGTDGIRGTSNSLPITSEVALKVGQAAGERFIRGDHKHRVVIGKDTRLSGYMLESALTAGFISVGMDVVLIGPMPTPAVAMLTRSMRADIGVMISASHNSYQDNGIKIFDPDGYKLSDSVEIEIENLMANGPGKRLADPADLGRAKRLDDAAGRYIEFAKNTFPRDRSLEGLKVVIDCANGAAYRVAPTVLFELGAEVITLGVDPNGFNINHNCGSTNTKELCSTVVSNNADVGIALDGDADRVIFCDETGKLIDGDQLMALIAAYWSKEDRIRGGAIISTVMSNLGLERYLDELGLSLKRTNVGDRYVVEEMRATGCNFGGEQSGHIIMSDYATTGDGLIAALQVLSVFCHSDNPVSEVGRSFIPVPQKLVNVESVLDDPLAKSNVKSVIRECEKKLAGNGRLLVRKSGTEPIIRVMAECDNQEVIDIVINDIVSAVQEAKQ